MLNNIIMINILIITVIVYIGICIVLYFFQHLFFFRPELLPASFKFDYSFPFEELEFDMEDGGRINGIHFKVPSARGVVYYLKGNSRSIKGWGKFAKDFLSNGYDLFMIDYRGFGKSKGKRTQSKLFNDAQYMYKWLSKQYIEDKIILYGRSFGSGIAARIASWNNSGLLILDSPYFSFYHNVKRFLFFIPLKLILRYDIRTDQYLKKIECPVHIIHGDKDRLFPIKQSRQLKNLYPDKIMLSEIQNAHHNDLQEFSEYFETIYDILYIKPNHINPAL